MCRVEVESCYDSRTEDVGCLNPEFYELPDRPSFRVIENTRPTA